MKETIRWLSVFPAFHLSFAAVGWLTVCILFWPLGGINFYFTTAGLVTSSFIVGFGSFMLPALLAPRNRFYTVCYLGLYFLAVCVFITVMAYLASSDDLDSLKKSIGVQTHIPLALGYFVSLFLAKKIDANSSSKSTSES